MDAKWSGQPWLGMLRRRNRQVNERQELVVGCKTAHYPGASFYLGDVIEKSPYRSLTKSGPRHLDRVGFGFRPAPPLENTLPALTSRTVPQT